MRKLVLTLVFSVPMMSCLAQSNIFEQNGNVGIGIVQPKNRLDVNGHLGISTAQIPMGINSENTGTYEPLINFSLNFREPNTNHSYVGAGFRLDSRPGFPLFQWIIRRPGHVFEQEYEAMVLTREGNLGIGTGAPQERLSVNGKIRAREIRVEVNNWPDYVFSPEHSLPSLSSIKSFVMEHKHLPEIPSAQEVEVQGIDLGVLNAKLLRKVEELTLYLIEKDEEIKKSNGKIQLIEKKLYELISAQK